MGDNICFPVQAKPNLEDKIDSLNVFGISDGGISPLTSLLKEAPKEYK